MSLPMSNPNQDLFSRFCVFVAKVKKIITLYLHGIYLLSHYHKGIIMSIKTDTEQQEINKVIEVENGKTKLRKWLNMNFRIEMTDGRVLIGVFLCTDRDANVILGACSEYLKNTNGETEEPRVLGLVMVPGRHIVSIKLDDTTPPMKLYYDE